MITGYDSALAIDAEHHIAKNLGVPRSEIETQMDSNTRLHDEVTDVYQSSQFLCRKEGVHLAELALKVVNNLRERGITGNRSAHYYVLNELARIQPCN